MTACGAKRSPNHSPKPGDMIGQAFQICVSLPPPGLLAFPAAFASQAIVLARGRGKSAGWHQVASPAAAHPGVLCGRQAGDSSVGRASDCRMCSYQMVPGSIPGRRILLPSAKSMITGRSSEDDCACSPAGQQWRGAVSRMSSLWGVMR
jgi:hypothetical protein